MRDYIDVTGKNEDEAISKALSQLGLDRDDVSVEVLERAKSGFLGLGACPAKIRVYYGPEEEEEILSPAPQPPVPEKPVRPAAPEEPGPSQEELQALALEALMALFPDAQDAPAYSLPHFQTLVEMGAFPAENGLLAPNAPMTRAVICRVLATLH